MDPDDLIGTGEAAEIIGVSQVQIKRLAKRGVIRSVRKMPGQTGMYVFQRGDVEAYRDARNALYEARRLKTGTAISPSGAGSEPALVRGAVTDLRGPDGPRPRPGRAPSHPEARP